MEQEIIEGNKLIAEFMGGGYKTVYWGGEPVEQFCLADKFDGSVGNCLKFLEYHSSWDWLMSVVEKIEHIKGATVIFSQTGCEILSFGRLIYKARLDTKIQSVWLAVIEFITWYNRNK